MTTDTDIIDVQSREVVKVEPLALIQGAPADVVGRATEMADVLANVIESRKLYRQIGAKKHVYVEGWTTLGAMVGVFPVVEWSRAVEGGWEARVEVRTLQGSLMGAAEAQCTRSEAQWKTRDDYALRSMAQTRATSKAMRLPLAWIMALAGYDATPAEEMPATPRAAAKPTNGSATPENGSSAQDTLKLRYEVNKAVADTIPIDDREQWFADNVPEGMGQLSAERCREVLAKLA